MANPPSLPPEYNPNPPVTYNPTFNASNFTSPGFITNQYFPLTPGTTLVYDGTGGETIRFEVTYDTRSIVGVTCIVVLDQAYTADGTLIEKTYDYFAQDNIGNVWYFGESVKNFNEETGKLEDKEGSWLSGVKGAAPGIIMPGPAGLALDPLVYNQENAAKSGAADYAQVLSRTATADDVPYGSFTTLQTSDGSRLDPLLQEEKFYASGIGLVKAIDLPIVGGVPAAQEVLIRTEFNGTSKGDTYSGNVGTDWLYGNDGDDWLYGFDGDDIIAGGFGQDNLYGGGGGDKFVFLDAKESLTKAKRDFIHGFQSGIDKIDLSEIDANTKAAGDQSFTFIDANNFTGTAGQLRFAGGILEGDRNGDKVGDFFVEVVGVVASTDLILVSP